MCQFKFTVTRTSSSLPVRHVVRSSQSCHWHSSATGRGPWQQWHRDPSESLPIIQVCSAVFVCGCHWQWLPVTRARVEVVVYTRRILRLSCCR